MNTAFFGAPDFAAPVLNKLAKSGELSVTKVITKPSSPVFQQANRLGIPTLTLEELLAKIATSQTPPADIFIVAAFGKILSKELINLPKCKTLNIHPSLLPKLRGPSPIKTALLENHKKTGVTIIQMDEKMDHGPILAQAEVALTGKETFTDLAPKLFTLGAELLIEILPRWKDYCDAQTVSSKPFLSHSSIPSSPTRTYLPPKSQDHQAATFTKMLTREDGKIDWEKPAEEIDSMVRALNPWPGAWTTLAAFGTLDAAKAQGLKRKAQNSGKNKVKILKSHIDKNSKLVIDKLQVEGKKPISWGEFKAGYLR